MARNGFAGVARQALDKLGVEWEPTESERGCNEGRSTQVPVNPVVQIRAASPGIYGTAARSWCSSDKPTLEQLLEVQEHFALAAIDARASRDRDTNSQT